MRREYHRLAFYSLIALLSLTSSQLTSERNQNQLTPKGIEGAWQGELTVGMSLRIIVKINRTPEGILVGKMDSPDQGAMDIPIDTIIFKDDSLHFEIKKIFGAYDGKLSPEGTELIGHWKQMGMSFALNMKRLEKAPEVRRPQEPQKPYPYDEEEVAYENTRAGVKLAGTLTLPRTKPPFPAVILITGSGPQDRNETVFGHRPFLVLADYLTRRGIATLRGDDRGVGGSTGDPSRATSEDFAEDVLAGIEYLKSRKEIDSKKIGLIGHSEGGIIAPIVATRSHDVAFIVLMAGTGLTGEEILLMQGALLRKAMGASEDVIKRERETQKKIFHVIKEEMDTVVAKQRLREIISASIERLPEQEKKAMGDPSLMIEAQVRNSLSPWFRFFLTYDPKPALRKLSCPVLAINGEKDLQVPAKENLAAIEQALKEGGNKDNTIKELPGLNHLFQTAETGSITEYAKIEETISPSLLQMIGEWIEKHIK